MRWRFLDRVDQFEAWQSIAGRKAVSFEEYQLLRRHGRAGAFPESLVLECCVELARWLAAASSGFAATAALAEVDAFRFERPAGMGDVLEVCQRVAARPEGSMAVECGVSARGRPVASGRLVLALLPLEDGFDAELVRGWWGELRGPR